MAIHFVTRGELPDWISTALAELETERDLVDYAAGYQVPAERYEARRAACDRLLDAVVKLLKDGGWLTEPSG